jgi:chromate transporter
MSQQPDAVDASAPAPVRVPLTVIVREWARIGITGFGGPPAHIALLRRLCVQRNKWISETEFEDGIAATSLLPGPASTQLAIFCAWRLGGVPGAILGGACFIVPGLIVILALSVVFLAHSPPAWVTGAAAGAGAAVPAVAVSAAFGLVPASWQRAGPRLRGRTRWAGYVLAGALAADLAGQFVVVALLGCGLVEWAVRRPTRPRQAGAGAPPPKTRRKAGPASVLATLIAGRAVPGLAVGGRSLRLLATGAAAVGGLGSLAWVAIKVGALSFGGGFVIIPLMQQDAVHTYHWMTGAQFLSAVALGQVTPGPVVLTTAVVGYAAAGLAGGLLAVLVAFAPSFAFVLAGGRHFDKFRRSLNAQAFLAGAGPAAIGAIGGAAITLGLTLTHLWQIPVLLIAVGWLVVLRRGVVVAILGAAAIGMIVVAGLGVG